MKRPMFDMRTSRRWGFSLLFLFAAALVAAGAWGPLTGREENAALAEEGSGEEPTVKEKEKPVEDAAPAKEADAAGLGADGGLGIGGIGGEMIGVPAKKRLRYDGKTFAAWSDEWETELNPARRAVAIEAFTAFAKNGYGEEAARAIFNVIRQYDTHIIDSSPEGKLKSTAINAFNKIDRKYWAPLFTQALQSKDRKEVTFALSVIYKNREFAKSSLPLLLSLMRGKDSRTAVMAINTVRFMNPRPAELQKTLRQLVLSKQAEVVRAAAGALVSSTNRFGGSFGGGGGFGGGGAVFSGPRYAGAVRGSGGMAGMSGSGLISPRGAYFPELIEALKTADSNTAGSIGYALSLLHPKGELVTPALVELLKQEEPAKSNALWAFANLRHAAAEALPDILPLLTDENKYVRFNAMRAVNVVIDSQPRIGGAVDTQINAFYVKLKPPALAAIRDFLSEAIRSGNSGVRPAAVALWDRLPPAPKK